MLVPAAAVIPDLKVFSTFIGLKAFAAWLPNIGLNHLLYKWPLYILTALRAGEVPCTPKGAVKCVELWGTNCGESVELERL